MPQSYACLLYHLLFSTRDRMPLLTRDIQSRLFDYIGGIVREDKGRLLAGGGTADHIHLLVSIRRDQSVAEALRIIKARSSRWIHETSPTAREFAWQRGYGAFSIGHSGVGRVQRYIENQAEHHRALTFQDEFLRFLREYDIPYDEKYVWS